MEGLGDLIDGYEFHYPDELSPDNLDEVRAALGRPRHLLHRGRPAPRSAVRPRRPGQPRSGSCAREAQRIVREAAEFAGSLGAHLIIWPGGEGYNYPFQTPYADSWRWLIEGMAEAASDVRASTG